MWLALRQALVRGDVSLPAGTVPEGTRYGLRIEIHAPTKGPRSAVAASEPLVDGALSALHAGAPLTEAVMVTEVLAPRLGMASKRLLELLRDRWALFPGSPFVLGNGYLQLSPCGLALRVCQPAWSASASRSTASEWAAPARAAEPDGALPPEALAPSHPAAPPAMAEPTLPPPPSR